VHPNEIKKRVQQLQHAERTPTSQPPIYEYKLWVHVASEIILLDTYGQLMGVGVLRKMIIMIMMIMLIIIII